MKKTDALLKVHDNKYYILASSTYADDRTRQLNSGDAFAIYDRWGDIRQLGKGTHGIYYQGTRFVSEMELEVNHCRPLLLSSNVKSENEILSIDLTNPVLEQVPGCSVPEGVIHISRSKFLQNNVCHERINLHNFGEETWTLIVTLSFHADFKDIFEIRGIQRERRGELLKPTVTEKQYASLAYRGLDHLTRTTHLLFQPVPAELHPHLATYQITLAPGSDFTINTTVVFQTGGEPFFFENYTNALERMQNSLEQRKSKMGMVRTSNEQFNNWIDRSRHDLLSLLAPTPEGDYPYAGIPWYNTIFGRDGIITALETLWLAPDIARGVLRFLAARQAQERVPAWDAEPGKILHEVRNGEMAETGEIPFKSYYGGVDTTPLFLVLAGRYLRRTGDEETIRHLWGALLKALEWIDTYGDVDGDGFVEYQRKTVSGLANQGWKDSHDSISHRDGKLANYPVALCEVQGYVYEARLQLAYIARIFGEPWRAKKLEHQAATLKQQFNEKFWDPELGTYVLALDGEKNPCRVVASNAGHCLYSGIATPERARQISRTLMNDNMFTGWGIRTLSADEARYNPMSYHNGSVWPHDTALIASGMARYGLTEEAARLTGALFNASLYIDLQRLPELFCGFPSRKGEAPTTYPVACSPQAWSVASVFMLMQSFIQIEVDALEKKVYFRNPTLPGFLKYLQLPSLKCGDGHIDVAIFRKGARVSVSIAHKPEGWQVVHR